MSTDQTNKKPFGKSDRSSRESNKRRKTGNSMENDPSSGQPHQERDEEKTNRIDYSQQIGEFSNWNRRG